MTLEGDVNESLCALSNSLVDDGGAHGDFVGQHDNVSCSSDDAGVLSCNASDEQDVVAGFLDLVDSSGSTGNSLDEDDCLNSGVSGHVGDGCDGLLGLSGEVVRIGSSDNDVRVHFLHLHCSADFFVALGDSTGDDADLVLAGVGRAAACGHSEDHDQNEKQGYDSLHFVSSFLRNIFYDHYL